MVPLEALEMTMEPDNGNDNEALEALEMTSI